ncbi:L-aspartate oxidase [Nakamurella silvestris]|nr:L-aspartate oxidase [Nakamurella silvestris]
MTTSGVSWEAAVDVVVVGTGVAGLTCALDLAAGGSSVLVVTKGAVDEGNTGWAQGGVAVPMSATDLEGHIADTLVAGAGLSDEVATREILAGGAAAVRRLIARGATFDADTRQAAGPDPLDGLLRTREGGHHADRIIHAGGDATGAEIERALAGRSDLPATLTDHLALDLLLDAEGAVAGLQVLDPDGRIGVLRSPVVVLATGGSSEVYASGTNPSVATGDGIGIALRAGAAVADVEFVQFHPTALWSPRTAGAARGRRPLVTEALRGAGAVLVDTQGRRVMDGVHPLGDLAPRDVVSLAITRRLAEIGGPAHVYLDASAIPEAQFSSRFPTVLRSCRDQGINPPVDAIPVSPAAHYQCGGVIAGVDGRTAVDGLYAIGEVARTGLHGANRLASNSLLEGLVTGERTAAAVLRRAWRPPRPAAIPATGWVAPTGRADLQDLMSAHAGIGRTAEGLTGVRQEVAAVLSTAAVGPPTVAAVEATNLAMVSAALLAAALARTESRGSHVRLDHPETQIRPSRRRIRWVDGAPEVDASAATPSILVRTA